MAEKQTLLRREVRIRMNMVKSLQAIVVAALAPILLGAMPAHAQVQSVDPDAAIDGDLAGEQVTYPDTQTSAGPEDITGSSGGNGTPAENLPVENWDASDLGAATAAPAAPPADTYRQDDLMGAAEGVFGQGSAGLADIIEGLLRKQGEPNGYITGREASGAIAVGLRYGSGTLHHKIEGNKPVYWTGPSLGFDLGLNAGKAFVLVYNLHDSADIYHRFGAGEGQAYLVGGFHVSYMRRGDVVLIPVRMGAGLRLGANIGYMKFSKEQRWLPF